MTTASRIAINKAGAQPLQLGGSDENFQEPVTIKLVVVRNGMLHRRNDFFEARASEAIIARWFW